MVEAECGTKEGSMTERVSFVPSHEGDTVLPADQLFTRLLHLAHLPGQRFAVRDINAGIERTHSQLLSDVLIYRRIIKAGLSSDVVQDIRSGKEVYIHILALGGYEFTVAIIAILALGAIPSPLSIQYPLEEAAYFVRKSQAVAVLAGSPNLEFAKALEQEIRRTSETTFSCIPIQSSFHGNAVPLAEITISSDDYVNPNAPGLVIFTSGTTGPPKGAVLRKAAITDGVVALARILRLSDQDTLLHCLPVHHATGIWINFFLFLQAGACIEFKSGPFDPKWTWNRFRQGGLTFFSGVPTVYMRMMRYFEEHLNKLPSKEVDAYKSGPLALKACLCGTSALPKPINDWWTKMLGGRRIIQRYGATEIGVVFNMSIDDGEDTPDGSVGEATIGVDVKLSEGAEGEVLVRSFHMFSKYLNDPKATKEAHTLDGYYRTGDIARKEGKYYFITGRASVDIIKSGGYKISALDVEREILALPYIGEVMVVGVADPEYGHRVGAVVSLRHDKMARDFYTRHNRKPNALAIDDLRADLRSRLAGYKLPTLLRVIQGELPKSISGKVVKKTLGPEYFPDNFIQNPEVQVWSKSRNAISPRL
jgi:malonyl-CoA/methylmalonyl-CoA synthetase